MKLYFWNTVLLLGVISDTKASDDKRLMVRKNRLATKESGYCNRPKFNRKFQPLSVCNNGKVKSGALCYDPCPHGYERAGAMCYQKCLNGMRNDGLYCRWAEYVRAGHGNWRKNFCENKHKKSCEKKHGLWYPKCKQGYYWKKHTSATICHPINSSCKGFAYKAHLSCKKNEILSHGNPTILECPGNLEKQGGLCYETCKDAGTRQDRPFGERYQGIGHICWGPAPKGWICCGIGAANTRGKCAQMIFKQIFAILSDAIALATTIVKLVAAPPVGATDIALKIFDFSKQAINIGKTGIDINEVQSKTGGSQLMKDYNKLTEDVHKEIKEDPKNAYIFNKKKYTISYEDGETVSGTIVKLLEIGLELGGVKGIELKYLLSNLVNDVISDIEDDVGDSKERRLIVGSMKAFNQAKCDAPKNDKYEKYGYGDFNF